MHPRNKAAEVILTKLIGRQKFLKEKIGQGTTLADGVDSPFWKSYKQLVKSQLDVAERQLDGFEKLSENEVRAILTTRKNLRLFISMPSDFERNLEGMENELEKVNKLIDDRKSKL